MKLTPEFRAAIREHLRLVELLGSDHPDTMRAMYLSIRLAPEKIIDELHQEFAEANLFPDATGYLEDGTPMYSLNAMADKLGIPIKEAEKTMFDSLPKGGTLSSVGILTNTDLVHTKQ
jgi:hypothetical protein